MPINNSSHENITTPKASKLFKKGRNYKMKDCFRVTCTWGNTYYVCTAILFSSTRIHFITPPALVQGRAKYYSLIHRVERELFEMPLRESISDTDYSCTHVNTRHMSVPCVHMGAAVVRLQLHPCEHTAHEYDDTKMVEPYGTPLSSKSDPEREPRITRTASSNPLLQYSYRFHYPLSAIIPSRSTSATTHNSYCRVVIRRKDSQLMVSFSHLLHHTATSLIQFLHSQFLMQ